MIFFCNFSEVGGFPKTLHNFWGWSDEILTLPYKGRYMVKKWQKHPYVIKEWPLRLGRICCAAYLADSKPYFQEVHAKHIRKP